VALDFLCGPLRILRALCGYVPGWQLQDLTAKSAKDSQRAAKAREEILSPNGVR
jgi:hypothetical protein